MEGCFNDENVLLGRIEADRLLRSYRRMNDVLSSSRSYGRGSFDDGAMDEAAVHAQLYYIRSLVLSVEDVRERVLLYNHYIKGTTLKKCAKGLKLSLRSVYRIKNRALDSVLQKIEESRKEKNDFLSGG